MYNIVSVDVFLLQPSGLSDFYEENQKHNISKPFGEITRVMNLYCRW